MFSEYSEPGQLPDDGPTALLRANRSELVSKIKSSGAFDFIVVGGGIHGATFARLAAFNGFRTLLLEQSDYASATSSRSSKMAHGGLRYLEMLDFRQIFDGIKSREDLYLTAPHLVQPQPFLFPVLDADLFNKAKLKIGFCIYDWFVKDRNRRAVFVDSTKIPKQLFSENSCPKAGVCYSDGILRDTRLVIENILAARQEGALCLNYARVDSIYHTKNGHVAVGWTDTLSGSKLESNCGLVINCCGPWVQQLGRLQRSNDGPQVRFSQGAHLLFNKPWKEPALIIPKEQKGQYYFVWPHFSGTMVGTTETELSDFPLDPMPFKSEVEELLGRLARDLPGSGLNRNSLHYCFAGVRTLVDSGLGKSSAALSRRPVWSFGQGMLSLLGGKFTTASITAFEGLQQAIKLAGIGRSICSLWGRKLPGSGSSEEFCKRAAELNLAPDLIHSVVSRYGSLSKFFLADDSLMQPIGNTAIRGEVEFALDVEQAESLEDIMRRRLELELLPDNGIGALAEIVEIFQIKRPQLAIMPQREAYEDRLQKLKTLFTN